MTAVIRVAEASDAAAIAQLNEHVQGLHHRERPDRFTAPDAAAFQPAVEAWLRAPDVRVFVAQAERELVGYATGVADTRPPTALKHGADLVELDQLVVAPTARRQGVGRSLCLAVIDWANDRGASRVELGTWAFNHRAIRLFTELGFEMTVHRMSRTLRGSPSSRAEHPDRPPSWWLDEGRTAGWDHLDPDAVAGYDAKAQFDPTSDIDALVALGLGPGSTLVDLGAGTGTFAVAAARTGAEVTAVDVSPAMVQVMRRRAAADDLGNLRVVEAGFLTYRPSGPPVDLVYSRNALHQLPDLWKVPALVGLRRLLRPGGHLLLRDLIFDVEPGQLDDTVEAWLDGAVDDPSRGYTAADLAEHLRTEHSTFRWLLEPMLDRAGFEILEVEFGRSVYARYLCRAIGDRRSPNR